MKRINSILQIMIGFSLVMVFFVTAKITFAQDRPNQSQALLEKYAPLLYFHPSELFRPQPVDVLVENARLRQNRSFWFDINILQNVSIPDLFAYQDDSYFLDAWYGDEELSESTNYSFHRFYYQTALQPAVGGHPIVAYGRLVQDDETGNIVLQYWLFYYYNDWFNKHEGDWELVQVMLDPGGDPLEVVLSQHHGGTRRVWRDTQIEEGTHPVAYVALGSHANYFWGDEIYPNGKDVGNSRIEIMDRTGNFDRVIPQVIPMPDVNAATLDGSEWLLFGGNWGETASIGDFGGPSGPAQKGQQWEQPYQWGVAQPLDSEVWYANRLRVEVQGENAEQAQISLLTVDGEETLSVEQNLGRAIMHRDPEPGEIIQAQIHLSSDAPVQIIATWPDQDNSQTWRYLFSDVPVSASGDISLTLTADSEPKLFIDGNADANLPVQGEAMPASWDAPDFVWMVNLLPVRDIAQGVSIALFAALLPVIFFVGVVYWADRYEKEPKRLLAIVFLWGAIPTLIFSLLARFFIQFPRSVFSPTLIAALRTGIVIPLIEELLKGSILVFILLRHRREFDNALDGVVYGSMVGLGYGMTRNLVSFLSSFFIHGFVGLGTEAVLTGVIFTLNQASYTAIFGAGLGYARLSQRDGPRRLMPIITFILAVVTHILHSLVVHAVRGVNILTVVLTLSGVLVTLVIILVSLKRQQEWMRVELKEQIPNDLYDVVVSSSARARDQWKALFSVGYQGWRKERRLHQSCTELAFKLRQVRLFPAEEGLKAEVSVLQADIERLIQDG